MSETFQKVILLVEDDTLIAAMEKKQLEKEGYSVIIAASGEQAIEIIRGGVEPVNLVLMDIDLGKGMDGTAAAVEILKNRNLPVVFLSSHIEKDIVKKTENITSYGYVVKDSGVTVLDASIKMAFKLFNANINLINKDRELKKSEEKFRLLHEQSAWSVSYFTPEGNVISFNERALEKLHLRIEDIEGRSLNDFYPPEVADVIMERINRAIASDGITEYEDYIDLPYVNGWFVNTYSRTFDDSNNIIAVQVISRNITEKKQAEESLREKDEFLMSIIDNIPDMIFVKDASDLKYVRINKAGEKLLGYRMEELVGRSDYDLFPEKQADFFNETDREVLRRSVFLDIPAEQIDTRTGTHILHTKKIPLYDDSGRPVYLLGISENITERKLVEEELNITNRTLERQKKLLGILNEIIAIANSADDKSSLFVNILDGALRLMDYDAGGIYIVDPDGCHARVVCSRNLDENFLMRVGVVATNDERYYGLFKKGIPVITSNYENISPVDAEETGFFSVISVPFYSKNRIIGSLNVASKSRCEVTDDEKDTLIAIGRELGTIISRITAEDESKKAVENMMTLFNSIDEIVFIFDNFGKIIHANETASRKLLYLIEEILYRDVLFLHAPEHRESASRIVREVLEGKTDLFQIPLLTKDGKLVDVETKITRGLWNGGDVIISVSRDISKRREIEKALDEAELKFRTIFEFASEGFLGAYEETRKLSIANIKICEMLGYTKDELMNFYLHDIHPEDSLQFVNEQFEKLLNNEISVARDIPLKRKNGEVLYADVSASIIVMNEMRYLLGLFRDITQRKIADEKIVNLLHEKEHLLKEAHHRVKNNMNTVSSLLTLQSDLQDDVKVKDILSDAAKRVYSMMAIYDKLYRLEINRDVSVKEYFLPLVKEITEIYPRHESVKVMTRFDDIILEPEIISITGILINELISNSMKYAVTGRDSCEIVIEILKCDDRVVIKYQDDGPGLPESVTLENPPGFGLQLVSMLVKQMSGSVGIDRSGGAVFIIEFVP